MNNELQELASQLRQPTGEKGIMIGNMMDTTNIKMSEHSIDNLQLQNNLSILELGHGKCGHLKYLLDKARNLTYYGLEISELMHQEALKQNLTAVSNKQATYSLFDGNNIPFQDETFNRIFTVNTIYFWSDPSAYIKEIYRVLSGNGILNITFAHKDFMLQLPFTQFGFTLHNVEEVIQLINSSPFSKTKINTDSEMIPNKLGELVNRTFSTISCYK